MELRDIGYIILMPITALILLGIIIIGLFRNKSVSESINEFLME